jgi:hypothetical protein
MSKFAFDIVIAIFTFIASVWWHLIEFAIREGGAEGGYTVTQVQKALSIQFDLILVAYTLMLGALMALNLVIGKPSKPKQEGVSSSENVITKLVIVFGIIILLTLSLPVVLKATQGLKGDFSTWLAVLGQDLIGLVSLLLAAYVSRGILHE